MAAVTRALYIEQGATFTLGFTWCQEGPLVDGVATAGDPYDLTGWKARMQVRVAQGETPLIDATDTNGMITLGGTAGRVDIKFTDEQTAALTSTSALYDLELENTTGDVFRLLQGTVSVSPSITQDAGEPVLA